MKSSAFLRYLLFSIRIQGRNSTQIIGALFFLFLPFLFFLFIMPKGQFYAALSPLFLCAFFLSNMVGFSTLFQEDKREGFLEALLLFPGLSLVHLCCVKAIVHGVFLGLPSLLLMVVFSMGSSVSFESAFFLFVLGFLILFPITFWGVFFSTLTLPVEREFWVQALLFFPFYMPLCFFGAWGIEGILKGEEILFSLLGILGIGLITIPLSLGGSIFILTEQAKGHTYKKGWEQW